MTETQQEPLPESLDTDPFRDAWSEWLDYRATDAKRPMSPRAQRMALRRLTDLGPTAAVAAIEHSIASGYRGIFPSPSTPRGAQDENPKSKIRNPKSLSTWETKERLKACNNALEELMYPGGCATAATLTGSDAEEALRLRKEIARLRKHLTATT